MGLMPTPRSGMDEQQAAPERDPSRYTDESDNNVSPEEQEQYSKFEENYLRLIYTDDGEVRPSILEALTPENEVDTQGEGPGPRVLALATVAVTITQQLDDSAREAGKPLSDDVLFQGGAAVIEELAEVAEAAGVHDYTEEEMSGALTVAVDMYRDKAMSDGRSDEETLKGLFEGAVEADKQGRLGEVVPGAGAQQQPQEA